MSIIYDALKKLEGNRRPENSQPAPDQSLVKPEKPSRPSNKKIIPVPAVLLAITVLIFSFTLGRQYILEKTSSLLSLIKKSDFPYQPESSGFELSPALKEDPKPEAYRLEGIIYDLYFPVAIINGNSFKKEDLVDEYRITKITESSVELVSTKDQTSLTLSIDF